MIHPFMLVASCGNYLQVVEDDGLLTAMAQRASERAATWPILAFDLFVLVMAVSAFSFSTGSPSDCG